MNDNFALEADSTMVELVVKHLLPGADGNLLGGENRRTHLIDHVVDQAGASLINQWC